MLIVRRHTPLALIVLIFAAGLFASAAAAAPTRPSSGALSHRLALVAKPTFTEGSPRSQANELGLPVRGAGSLLRLGNRYVADVRTAAPTGATARRLDRLAGVSVLGRSSRYRAVTVAASGGSLHRLAHQPRVAAVTEELTPMVSGAGPRTSAVCQGSVTSEGLTQLHADQVQNSLGDTGAGVTVGVLSDSFDRNTTAATHAANDVASGDLPGSGNPCGRSTPVNVLDDSDSSGKDEGRGMLQIVHDLAPDAKLAFATAFSGELNFANNIRALATAGAKVITDDVTYFDEPFFQDGPVAVAVNDVTAGGATYFSSAANNNLIDSSGRNIASWETPSFRDGGSCPAGLPGYAQHCLDFDPGPGVDNTFGITVDPGATLRVDLQWAQPWNGVATDLDAYLVGTSIKSENANRSTQKPFEFLAGTNTGSTPITVNLAINRCDTTCNPTSGGDSGTPRVKFALVQNGGGVSSTEYPTSSGGDTVGPTIFGHNGAANAMSTAAVPYNNSNTVEPYSSRGPLTQYFGPVNGTTPAPPISPTTLDKPDIAATDCAATTFFGSLSGGVWRFCGTSEAAPHAAAVAALELSANPVLSVAQVKAAQTSTAAPVGSFDHTAVGAGLLNAFAAVSSVVSTDTTPPDSIITSGPSGFTRDATPTFAFRSSEPGSTFQCRLDARAWAACSVAEDDRKAHPRPPHVLRPGGRQGKERRPNASQALVHRRYRPAQYNNHRRSLGPHQRCDAHLLLRLHRVRVELPVQGGWGSLRLLQLAEDDRSTHQGCPHVLRPGGRQGKERRPNASQALVHRRYRPAQYNNHRRSLGPHQRCDAHLLLRLHRVRVELPVQGGWCSLRLLQLAEDDRKAHPRPPHVLRPGGRQGKERRPNASQALVHRRHRRPEHKDQGRPGGADEEALGDVHVQVDRVRDLQVQARRRQIQGLRITEDLPAPGARQTQLQGQGHR